MQGAIEQGSYPELFEDNRCTGGRLYTGFVREARDLVIVRVRGSKKRGSLLRNVSWETNSESPTTLSVELLITERESASS